MNKDIKAINETYNQGIDHTTRNSDSYSNTVVDYANQRNEQEEGKQTLRKRVSFEINNMLERSKRGLPEDYKYILINLDNIKKNITNLL